MYSVLSFLLLRGIFLRQMKQMPRYQILLITFIFCTGVGVVIEFLQPVLTAYRKFEWLDMVANATGALGGIVIFRWLFSRSRFGLK